MLRKKSVPKLHEYTKEEKECFIKNNEVTTLYLGKSRQKIKYMLPGFSHRQKHEKTKTKQKIKK